MTLKTSLLGALALGLVATGAVAQNGVYGTSLPGDGPPMSTSSRPPARETPPGDLTPGTVASQSPASEIGYQPPSAVSAETPAYAAPTSATVADTDKGPEPRVTRTVAMSPIPDTRANRRLYGGPRSTGGRQTAAVGN
jgi:hypothetical protein